MDKEQVVRNTASFVQHTLEEAEGGHDWFHTLRVWKNARHIARTEDVDPFIVDLGALLHDIADSKFHDGNEEVGPQKARAFLEHQGLEERIIQHVENIIRNISFKGGREEKSFHSKELDVVQDADRLDAIGAIGIARAFNYGGFKNRKLHDPAVPPNLEMTKEQYMMSTAPTLNHFYEKLFLLKDLMNTDTGTSMALDRHQFMEQYVKQFLEEWEGYR